MGTVNNASNTKDGENGNYCHSGNTVVDVMLRSFTSFQQMEHKTMNYTVYSVQS